MTIQEAYKTLDLAKGLGMDRVEAQFNNLKTDIEKKLASTNNERLKQVYNNRLLQLEEARDYLNEYLQGNTNMNEIKETPVQIKTKKKKSKLAKRLLILLPIVLIGAFFLWQFQQFYFKTEVEKLAQQFCDCQKQNNEEYIHQLNEFINTFESQKFKFAKDAKKRLDQLSSDYESKNLMLSISNCFNNFEVNKKKLKKLIEKYSINSDGGKKFWTVFDDKITENANLKSQEDEISKFRDASVQKLSGIVFNDENDLKNRKRTIINLLNDFYTSYSGGYADAYDFFDYNVEQYISLKDITPTDINIELRENSDYIDHTFKIAPETLKLIKSEDEIETWEYAAEFQCYRPLLDEYQISNIWYEIKINASGKLMSYIERKVEKTNFFSPEDFNLMNNRNDYETDW